MVANLLVSERRLLNWSGLCETELLTIDLFECLLYRLV